MAMEVVAMVVIKLSIKLNECVAQAWTLMLTMRNVLIDRYQAICSPMKAHASASSSRSYGICVVVWIVAFCLNIPVFYLWVSMIAMHCQAHL